MYDKTKWEEVTPTPVNTLQLFITNRCNLRCVGCFMQHKLGAGDMTIRQYTDYVLKYVESCDIKKVIILGGEPTLHPNLLDMIKFNKELGLRTTVYTNGYNLSIGDMVINNPDFFHDVEFRVGVYGDIRSEKPLRNVQSTTMPLTIVYMLRQDNIDELKSTVISSNVLFNCKRFYISSIRDIANTHDFWKDTQETVPVDQYFSIVRDFILWYTNYDDRIPEIHIAKRGIIETETSKSQASHCRFGNIFPDGEKIICPLDISLKKTVPELKFGTVPCNKNGCIMQKIVLRRR